MAITPLDKTIADLAAGCDHKTVATWALDCAERVLPYFEKNYPEDSRPRQAIEAGRAWVSTGVFRMADIRKSALTAHAAARDVGSDDPARSAARAAGQAVATTHVAGHATAAAIYAATVLRDAANAGDAVAAAVKEREWQYQHLLDLAKRN